MSVQPETAERLVEELFLLSRAMRATVVSADLGHLQPWAVGILIALAEQGECRQNALAADLCISQSALSRQVADLIAAGYVSRSADPADGRASLVRVTDAGHELLCKLKVVRSGHLQQMLTDWSEDDASAAFVVLRKLKNSFSNHLQSTIGHRRDRVLVPDSNEG